MANVLTGNPIFIDTVGATSILTRKMDIMAILWVSDETAAIVADNDLLIVDNNAQTIISKRSEGNGDGLEIVFNKPFPVNGINVTAIDSGFLYIFTI